MSIEEIIEREERWQRYLNADIPADDDEVVGWQPCRAPTPNTVPAKPGNGNAAYKAGCEDEWSNEMNVRYGGEW